MVQSETMALLEDDVLPSLIYQHPKVEGCYQAAQVLKHVSQETSLVEPTSSPLTAQETSAQLAESEAPPPAGHRPPVPPKPNGQTDLLTATGDLSIGETGKVTVAAAEEQEDTIIIVF